MVTAPEQDTDVLLRSGVGQKLLPGNLGPQGNLLGWGAGSTLPHLVSSRLVSSRHLLREGEETCVGLPTAVCSEHRQNCPTGSREGPRALFLRAAREPSLGKWLPQQNVVRSFSDWLYHMHSYKRNWAISLKQKRPQPLASCWCSLGQGKGKSWWSWKCLWQQKLLWLSMAFVPIPAFLLKHDLRTLG